MAGEIKLTVLLKFAKSSTTTEAKVNDLAVTVTGTRFIHNRQSIGTSEEALDLGDIATGGWFVAINRGATNFIEIRSGTGATDIIKLKAGEPCCFRMSGDATAPFAIANTAAGDLEYWLFED